jgi:hypothetical protein
MNSGPVFGGNLLGCAKSIELASMKRKGNGISKIETGRCTMSRNTVVVFLDIIWHYVSIKNITLQRLDFVAVLR